MATINVIKPKAANGTSGASPTNGANGLDATFTQNGQITADHLIVNATGGEGGDGGNGAAVPGANGGNGGKATITANGNIFNGAPATTLSVSLNATGGNGGLGGTGTPAGAMGNGGNATVTANGNIIQPNKIMTSIDLDAVAIGGNGTKKGNAAATLNGNIIQNSMTTDSVTLEAIAYVAGADSTANHGNANFGTKTATVNGNIVQGNISDVGIYADAYSSNATATMNGNIIQTKATNTGTVTMEATGNKISITNNKVQLGLQSFFLTVHPLGPTYDTTIKDNEFKGTGLNAFTFTDIVSPGLHTDTVSINLATNSFVFNGQNNLITGFKSITVLGNVAATLTGTSGDDILNGGDGDDIIDGGGGNDIIYGGKGNDILTGGDGNDELHGNDGDDVLDGGIGDDLLFGGAGDDILLVSTGTDVLDGMTDPLGDTASFQNATTGGVTVDLNSPGPHNYSSAFNNVLTVTTLLNIQNVTGTGFADTLIGDAQNNTLTGGAGNDILRGNGGNDTLNGGANSDTAIYDGNYNQYTVAVNASGDGTVADLRLGTPNGNDTLSSIEFIQFDDGTYNTATQTFVPNGPVNTAPTLDNSKSPTLTTVLEDPGAPSGAVGNLVSDLVDFATPSGQVDNVTDPDGGALLGIALTGAAAGGTVWFSTDGGTNWTQASSPSDTNAVLLNADASTRVYFQPGANANGPITNALTFRAWDRTTGTNGQTGVNVSTNGGSTAFSTASDTVAITVTAVNDAPAGTDGAVLINEDSQYTLTAADFGFTDPNDSPANALTAVKITTLPGAGTLTNNNVAVIAGQSISIADITGGNLKFTPALNSTSSTNLTFQVQDDGGTANGGVDLDQSANTLTFNITAVNDAPAGTDHTVTTLNEDGIYTFTAGDFGFTDPNDSPANTLLAVKITTLPGAGSLTNNNVAVTLGQFISLADINGGNLKFTPAANANGNNYANFTFQVQDNGGTANGGVDLDQSANLMTINVNSVNDAPAGTDATLSTALNTPYTFTAGDFGFTDPDDSPADTLLAVKITTLPTDGLLTNNNVAVAPGQFISLADINGGNLKFTPDIGEFGTGYATFTFQVQDDGGTANGGVDLDPSANTITFDVQGGENYFGTASDNNHTGTAFDDVMHVSAGNDTLNGGGHVNGDTLTFDTADNGVTATINALVGGYTVGGFAGTVNASNFEHLTGSNFDDVLTGDAGQNTITGGDGDDVLVATVGGDTLIGGNNTAIGDTADFSLGSGVTVDLANTGSQNVGGGIGFITLTGIENLTGSGAADILYGDSNANTLNGAGGDDFLVGNGGGDTLDGGTGTDTAEYSFTIDPTDITWDTGSSSFKFDTGSGIDTLKNVEVVEKSGLPAEPRVLLVGGGGYASINAAIADANDGDTILVAPGTYNENVVVNAEVTIRGLGAPGDVIIHGTFATHNGSGATPVNEFMHGAYDVAGVGDGITVNADNVTLSNLTVEYFDSAIRASGAHVDDLKLDGVTLQHSVTGFFKSDATALNRLVIDGSTFSDDYYGVILANGVYPPTTNQDATDTTIINSTFVDLTEKGIYAETLQGTTLFDNLTMNNVGEFGRGSGFGALGTNGAGIDVNLKFHTYVGSITISDFDFTNVGSSNQDGAAAPHGNGAAIAVKARDDLGHSQYGVVPADASGLTVSIQDGTINGTSTGIRLGEGLKADTAHNVTGPAATLDGVTVTNALTSEVDNDTHSTLTIIGTSGNDIYTSGQSVASTGKIVFIADQGDDTYFGGTGGNNKVDYSAGIGTGPNSDIGVTVDLLAGYASGAGLGNDTLGAIQDVVGTDYNDVLIGDGDNNNLSGGDGNDILYGHGGINLLSGGNGTDVAYYYGQESTYIVGGGPGAFLLFNGPEGVGDFGNFIPEIAGVERLKFLAPSHVSDIDNGGYSDLIFQDAGSGDLDIRTQEGPSSTAVTTGGINWRVVGTGQFDPDLDRTADVLLQDSVTGDLRIITDLNGAQTDTGVFASPGIAWKAITTGDFNGDAASDVVLQNQSTGAIQMLFLNEADGDAPGTVSEAGFIVPGANWKVISAGDFNGDGKSDILLQNSTTKAVEVYLMNGTSITNTPAIQATGGLTAVGTGDFNGDGNSDILFKNAAGNAVLWFMQGASRTGTKTINKPGANFTLSGAADVDGNGYSDLIWSDTVTAPASPVTTATQLGGPSSSVSTTVLGNFNITNPGAGFNLIASTGGG